MRAEDESASTPIAAARVLAGRDPVVADLVAAHGLPRFRARPAVDERFESLCRSIVGQQLAGSAARAIWSRARATVDGPFTPAAVLAVGEGPLRGAGLSGAKVRAVLDLAARTADGRLRLDRLGRLDDDGVVAELTQVWGVGEWTAHMFLMFGLRRLDVWPTGDLGVRNGFARAWGHDPAPTATELAPLGDRFRPYRSVIAWYCWRTVDTDLLTD